MQCLQSVRHHTIQHTLNKWFARMKDRRGADHSKSQECTLPDLSVSRWTRKKKQKKKTRKIPTHHFHMHKLKRSPFRSTVPRTQTADDFMKKLNAFISHWETPHYHIRKCCSIQGNSRLDQNYQEIKKLQNYLANQNICWQCNLARATWWRGVCERLIKENKKSS